jgi:hypothetical protein
MNTIPEKYVIKNLQPNYTKSTTPNNTATNTVKTMNSNSDNITANDSKNTRNDMNNNNSAATNTSADTATEVVPPYDVSIQLARLVDINGNTCACPNCGDIIELLSLTAEERNNAKAALRDIITERKHMKRLEQLKVCTILNVFFVTICILF